MKNRILGRTNPAEPNESLTLRKRWNVVARFSDSLDPPGNRLDAHRRSH
jgi:hypothetical protein